MVLQWIVFSTIGRPRPWLHMWQVLVPRASLAGHLCGIATGVLRAYAGPHGAAEAILLASL